MDDGGMAKAADRQPTSTTKTAPAVPTRPIGVRVPPHQEDSLTKRGGLVAAWHRRAVAPARERQVRWIQQMLLGMGVLGDLRLGRGEPVR
jgi:hypothetical protein